MAAIALASVAISVAMIPCCLRRTGVPARLFAAATRRPPAAVLRQPPPDQRGRFIDSIDEAAEALRAGRLVAFPTETVYGLGAHAFDADAVASIFTVKGRPRSDPLIVHVSTPAAAEALVMLDAKGLALMRQLMASFWPGPLTLVAPACPALPPAVTAGTGWVGVRMPKHTRALELLSAAAVPVAAPSANRFGHVSPTRPEHVMDDLGAHPILVLNPDKASAGAPSTCCDVGIESTVLKLDAAASELLLLRRGGVPEAELVRWLAATPTGFKLRIQPPKQALKHPPPTSPVDEAATDAAATGSSEMTGMVAPGMLLTHYAPDLPSFLVRAPPHDPTAPASGAPLPPPMRFALRDAVLLDFGGQLRRFESSCCAYRDLSPTADANEAAALVFEALRWAEAQTARGGRCVLLPNLMPPSEGGMGGARAPPSSSSLTDEALPAVADRLFRAASGREAWLSADEQSLVVEPED
jgi:tRNA threonylcarbamoyl adenosine modification protein (Sua5/YciO/YrdC/YwlC family)